MQYGEYDDCSDFIDNYKRLTGIWNKHNQTEPANLSEMEVGLWRIKEEDLQEKICYVLRNPMAAKLGCTPLNYRWSSASLYFSQNYIPKRMKEIGTMSEMRRRNRFSTKVSFPQNWCYDEDDMIWPGCYVAVEFVEKLFGNPSAFLFELNQRVEAKVNLEMSRERVSLPDHEIIAKRKEISLSMFSTGNILELSLDKRIQLAERMRKETGASVKQIARIVHLKYSDLIQIII